MLHFKHLQAFSDVTKEAKVWQLTEWKLLPVMLYCIFFIKDASSKKDNGYPPHFSLYNYI